VINIDSEYAPRFLEATVDTLYSFGTLPNAQIRAQDIVTSKEGTSFTVRMPSGTFTINTKLCGEFNVWNMLAAVGVLISQRVDSDIIKETMENLGTLPGRLQEVSTNFPFTVFVDYAHTEESLRNVLETIRSFGNIKRIITVFGATGDRDRDKRPKMGAMVHKLSDVIILTEDDNYTEDQFRIMNEVSKGIKRKEGEDFWIIFNREDAIRTALILAQKDDVVLLAGK